MWRFWEGITRQGAHEAYSKFKNFFSFRLSPLVSGVVYLAYLAFCATLVPKTWHDNAQNVRSAPSQMVVCSCQAHALDSLMLQVTFAFPVPGRCAAIHPIAR